MVSFFLHKGQHFVTWIAVLIHSLQNICPHVVAVMFFISPKQIAHSSETFPSFSLSLSLLLLFVVGGVGFGIVGLLLVCGLWLWWEEVQETEEEGEEDEEEEEEEDDVVVVVVPKEEEEFDSLTPVISNSSGLIGDGGSTGNNSCLIWSLNVARGTALLSSSEYKIMNIECALKKYSLSTYHRLRIEMGVISLILVKFSVQQC